MSDSDQAFANVPRPLRWLFLDLNAYFASVEQQLQPHLRGRPVIVAPVDSDTTVAIAASYEAKAHGITTGTPVWEAKRRCRDLLITPARHDMYVDYHHRIVAEIERHIPVTKVCSIDEVACRLLDNENGAEDVRDLARRLKAGIRDHVGEYLSCSVGVAPNRLLAKLASDMQKPDGLVILDQAELPHRLFALELQDIAGIGEKMAARLARDGVTTIEELCARRPREAGTAYGSRDGDRLWYALHGFDLPEKPTQSRTVGHSHVLSPQARAPEPARLTARRLALKAASRLRRGAWSARLLILHGRLEVTKARWHMSQRMPPTQDSFAVLATLDRLWARAAHDLGLQRLRMIGVTLAEIAPDEGDQPSLWSRLDPGDPLARETRTLGLSRAMDRVNERWGRNAVSVGPLTGGRLDRVGAKIAFGRIPEAAEFHE